jgi:hypothetical protein
MLQAHPVMPAPATPFLAANAQQTIRCAARSEAGTAADGRLTVVLKTTDASKWAKAGILLIHQDISATGRSSPASLADAMFIP